MTAAQPERDEERVLPEDVPVEMPVLPVRLRVSSAQQFKALGDPVRWRILDVIQYRPATGKQIATIRKMSPGTVGHHLQVLEAAGLVQVVARRLVHGIVAKYYTRTARIFDLDFPPEIKGKSSISIDMLTSARDQLAEVLTLEDEGTVQQESDADGCKVAFPRARLSAERIQAYRERINSLIEDFINETPDPDGQVYSLSLAFFKAPPYLQSNALLDREGASLADAS